MSNEPIAQPRTVPLRSEWDKASPLRKPLSTSVPKEFFAAAKDWLFDTAAQLAYWSMLALFPFAIVLLTLIAFLPIHGLDRQLLGMLHHLLPVDAAQLFESTVGEIVGHQHGWLLAVAIVGALWTASGGVSALITALNRAWNVEETRPYWKVKLLAIAVTLATIGLIAVAMAAFLIGPELIHTLTDWLGFGPLVDLAWRILRWPVVIVTLTAMLSVLYWLLPNRPIEYRFLSLGAILGTLAWVVASLGFRAYVARVGSYSKLYGTLGAGVVLMTWLFLSGVVVILGGLLNAVRARRSKAAGPEKTKRL